METIKKDILELKKEKKAVILAHYYVDAEVQAIADYVGDSYYLAKTVKNIDADVIVFCGVSFMGESAKILNPDKMVLMPDINADCPMAHMASIERIKALKKEYDDLAVVCYINSTAELKSYCDVCVTSSNAVKVVKKLSNKQILFVPDENLGCYVAEQVPEKQILFNDGYCPIHKGIDSEALLALKKQHPEAKILAHPECRWEILQIADYVGSTSGIIEYAHKDSNSAYIVATEIGILYQLKKNNPEKQFYFPERKPCCTDMKKVTLEKIRNVLLTGENEVKVSREMREKSLIPLQRMLELAK